MGFDYSFELITLRDRVERLIAATADHAVGENRDLLLRLEPEQDPCLTFRFPIDGALLRYPDEPPRASAKYVDIGCIYPSLMIGSRLALLRITAATTDMSLLFEESPNIRVTFRDVARAADALSVLFDRETDQYVQVWPNEVQFNVADLSRETDEPGIDSYCKAMLAAASSARDGRAPEWPSWEEKWLERDREFYTLLGDDRPEIPCRESHCGRGCIRLSVFCRLHHFEHVRMRKCPFSD